VDDQSDDDTADDENVNRNRNKSSRAQLAAQAIRKQVMPSVPVTVICMFFVLILFLSLIRNFFFPNKAAQDANSSISWPIRVTTMTTFIANLTALVSLLAMSMMMITTDAWDLDMFVKVFLPYSFVSVGYIVGKASLETFFILRVYKAFADSAFALSKCTVVVLCVVLSLIAFVWLFLLVIDQREWENIDRDYDYLILSSLDAVFVTVLLVMFSKRLNALVLMQKSDAMLMMTEMPSQQIQSAHDPDNDDDEEDPVVPQPSRSQTIAAVQSQLTSSQTKIIFVITRCIILNIVAFLTTIIFGFFAFYYVRYGAHLYILYSLWSLDMSINLLCLYLNFVFASKWYRRCCFCFHRRAQRWVEYRTAAVIVDEHVQSVQAAQTHEVSTVGAI